MGVGDEDTVASFPTYAHLTQTAGWTTLAPAISGFESTAVMEAVGPTRYMERTMLGQGGMGKVMLAHDARVGRDVAVKQLHDEREFAPEDRARFLREARVQGQLEHPSIVPVYDIDERADGTSFFTMRRVLGRTLQAIVEELRAGDPLAISRYTQRELLTAFATICLTVDYAHSRGVIHRDLKPANVMLGDFGEVYVLDWGLARVLGEELHATSEIPERLSMTGELLGTPLYMAPEQMADPAVGIAADVFSLGAMLFEILTFERLRDPKSIYAPPDARPSVRTPSLDVAPELETICVRATQADPADRFPSPRALHDALVRYLEGDRDREQRVRRAQHHAEQARAALTRAELASEDAYETERGIALRELTRAIALDPDNTDYPSLLATTLATPPRTIPVEVQQELLRETQRIVKSGANFSVFAMLSWFIFLPIMLVIGVRDTTELAAIIVAASVGMVCSVITARQRITTPSVQIATLLAILVAATVLSRMYGPLILMPTLLACYVITVQSHPWRFFRRFGLTVGMIAMVAPLALEIAGIVSPTYLFESGRWLVLPRVLDLPRSGTIALLTLANLTMLVVPCMFVARLRADLSNVQTRQLLQKWQFRRLGDELVERNR